MTNEERFEKAEDWEQIEFEISITEQKMGLINDLMSKNDLYVKNLKSISKFRTLQTKEWGRMNSNLDPIPINFISQWVTNTFHSVSPKSGFPRYLKPHEIFEQIRLLKEKERLDLEMEILSTNVQIPSYEYNGKKTSQYCPIGLKVTKKTSEENKPGILILGGTHGDEFITPIAVLNFLERTLNNVLLEKFELYVMPLVNPSGLEISIEHRKGHRKNGNSKYHNGEGQVGVDPNRNYPIYFGYCDAGLTPGSDTFCGPHPFSEHEPTVIDKLLQDHPNIVAAIDVHAGEDFYLYHPNSEQGKRTHVKNHRSYARFMKDIDRLMYQIIDSEVSEALNDCDIHYNLLSPDEAAGTSDEYFYHGVGILGFSVEIGNRIPDLTQQYLDKELETFNTLLESIIRSVVKFRMLQFISHHKNNNT